MHYLSEEVIFRITVLLTGGAVCLTFVVALVVVLVIVSIRRRGK
jgi:hypothetical protein